jgi:hypothetical protein
MRALGLVVMLTLIPSVASAGSGWAVKCPYSHSNNDDPIKFPRQQGATHLHDFYGSMTTNYLSTYSSMRASPSTCGTAGDTSGYWAPALYRNGVRVFPQGSFDGEETREQFYYRKDNLSSGTTVEPFPANFKMIQGYAMAMSLADANAQGAEWGSEMYWGCSDNNPDDKFTAPISCKTGVVTLHVGFPNCWDGMAVDGDAVAAGHVRFPSDGACPAGFPHKLPRLIARFEYPVGTSSSGITVSSGAPYTAHADFWNTWQQTSKLAVLVENCLNADVDCGIDP